MLVSIFGALIVFYYYITCIVIFKILLLCSLCVFSAIFIANEHSLVLKKASLFMQKKKNEDAFYAFLTLQRIRLEMICAVCYLERS